MRVSLKKTTEICLLLTVLIIPLYQIRFSIFFIPTNVLEVFAVASIILFLFYYKNNHSNFPGFTTKPTRPAFILLLGLLLSLVAEKNFSFHGLGILKGWFLIPIIFSFSLAVFFKKNGGYEKVFYFLYLSVLIVSIISLLYGLFNLTTFDGRLKAFYSSPNQLAIYISLGIISFFHVLFEEKRVIFRHVLIASLLFPISALFLTLSYASWASLSLTLLLVAFLFRHFHKKTLFSAVAIFLMACFFLLSQAGSSKLSSVFQERSSFSSRVMIWNSSLRMISEKPLFGIGPGNFQKTYLNYQKFFPPYLEWAVPHPHNTYLSFWLQSGLLGLVAFLWLVFSVIFSALKNKNSALSAVTVGVLAYIMIHGTLDETFWKNDLAYIFWLTIFMSTAFISTKNQDDKEARQLYL